LTHGDSLYTLVFIKRNFYQQTQQWVLEDKKGLSVVASGRGNKLPIIEYLIGFLHPQTEGVHEYRHRQEWNKNKSMNTTEE